MLAKQERKNIYGSRARPLTPFEAPKLAPAHRASSDIFSRDELTRGTIRDFELPSRGSAASSTHGDGIRLVQGKGKG